MLLTALSPANFLAVGLGAVLGAWLRWLLGIFLNPLLLHLPLGTLFANVLGGFLIGLALGFFQLHSDVSPALKLLVITGFLGGLTTFSTFSAEVVERLLAGQIYWAIALAALHLSGSLLATYLGLLSIGAARM